MRIPITYQTDRRKAEEVLLECATRHTIPIQELSQPALDKMRERYGIQRVDMTPRCITG